MLLYFYIKKKDHLYLKWNYNALAVTDVIFDRLRDNMIKKII